MIAISGKLMNVSTALHTSENTDKITESSKIYRNRERIWSIN